MARSRPPLTRGRIVTAAVRLLNEDGETGFSMRRLAKALGVDAMAVYHHLPNKAAVVHAAIAAMVADCDLPAPHGPWPARVRHLCRSVRALARRHPGVFPLYCVHQTFVPGDFPIQEALLAAVDEARLPPTDTVHAASTLLRYTAGFALDESTGTIRPLTAAEGDLMRALPVGDFPATARCLDAMLSLDLDTAFDVGLDLLIAGIQAKARTDADADADADAAHG